MAGTRGVWFPILTALALLILGPSRSFSCRLRDIDLTLGRSNVELDVSDDFDLWPMGSSHSKLGVFTWRSCTLRISSDGKYWYS